MPPSTAWIAPLAAAAFSSVSLAAADRPNILWLIAEDFGQHLGCYGVEEVTTPHLDALAAAGMRYEQFFTTAPICSPSRSAFNTGMYQTTLGAHHHRTSDALKPHLPPGVRLLSQRLADAGYRTANLRRYRSDTPVFPSGLDITSRGKTDWNFQVTGTAFQTADWGNIIANQPFYAQINFKETHREGDGSYAAPPEIDPASVDLPPYYPDHPTARADWARYLDSANELDRKVGQILDQLEADGLADNTIVVFLGDNGESQARGKQFVYDSGLNVPFIVYIPPAYQPQANYTPGTVSYELLEAIDLTAQTLAWAGIEKPSGMEGRVFLGPHAEEPRSVTFAARDRSGEATLRLRSARDERYRYIRNYTWERPLMLYNQYKTEYPTWNLLLSMAAAQQLNEVQAFFTLPTAPPEELYDTWNDPHETLNLAASTDPDLQQVKERLRAALWDWSQRTADRNPVTEPTTPLEVLGEDWWASPHLGTMSTWHYPYLYFPKSGRWAFQATTEDPMIGRWIHDPEMGWLWCVPDAPGYFYQLAQGRFLFCRDYDARNRLFYRRMTFSWQPLPKS